MDLDEIILSSLRTGGPYRLDELTGELQRRADAGLLEGVTGLVGAGAVVSSLRRLRAAGRAVEGEEGWEWRPERPEKVPVIRGQLSFLDDERPCTIAGKMAEKAGEPWA